MKEDSNIEKMVSKKTEKRILKENKDIFDALEEYDKTGKLRKLKKKKI